MEAAGSLPAACSLHLCTSCFFFFVIWLEGADDEHCSGNYFRILNNSPVLCLQGEEAVSPPLELKIALNKQVLVEGKYTIIYQTPDPACVCECSIERA